MEPRWSGGGEEREWSEKTAGGDPPQGDQFHRTILGQLAYKWSSSPDAPTDENTGSDCAPRSCRGRETEDDHGESAPSVTAAAAAAATTAAAAAASHRRPTYILCVPRHINASDAVAPNREDVCHLSASSALSSGVMTGLPTVAGRPAVSPCQTLAANNNISARAK